MSDAGPRVVALHRYPVKSLVGEAMPRLDVDGRGVVGDRVWSVRTPENKIGSGKETRRFATVLGLLELRAAHVDGGVTVTFPDGGSCPVGTPEADARLSRFIGRPLTFARESDVSHFDDGPVSLLGVGSVDALARERGVAVDVRRFRANVLLDIAEPFAEEAWVGRDVRLGSAVLRVSMPSPRCVMVDMRTADLPEQPGNLKALGALNGARLGVVAAVVTPGTVAVGDRAVPL